VLRPVPEVFAPAGLVRRAWEALGATGVPFTLDDRSGGWLALADPDQVDQMIWGLLDNAVKYGGGAPITVTVALVPGEGAGAGGGTGGGTLRLRVQDAGPGIAEADRDRLFERYARGTLPGAEGTGLGLYVSRELARANGGDLLLDAPIDGSSAVFSVYLPGETAEEG
jgi:signal transduction histidine kinase